MSDEKKRREAELDAFWDIDALIPPKRAPHYVGNTDTAEIVLDPIALAEPDPTPDRSQAIPPPADSAPKRHFIPPHSAEEEQKAPAPDVEYVPENALVRRVRLYRWRSNYRYYESFVLDAVKLYPIRAGECARVPFFSYVPQYSQMTRPQLEWYLYWREGARQGVWRDTDYSYVLLYIYELINLSDRLEPLKVQAALCGIWAHYRTIYRQLDTYLPEWICDHCLIHHLPPPDLCTGELLSVAMAHCSLKEFYVPTSGDDGYISALLAFCSNYEYRKSKFYTGENVPLFDRVIAGALREVTKLTSADGKLFVSAKMDDSKLLRDAYTGALCSYRIKRKIEVEYCSFSRTHELRYFLTDVVKYTENRLRGVIGVRSRLSVYALPVAVRTHLDTYLDGVLPQRKPISKKEEAPAEYERLYDLPRTELSLSGAAEIERLSWETTERLVEAFEENGDQPSVSETSAVPMPEPILMPEAEKTADTESAWTRYLPFLRAALEADRKGETDAAAALGRSLDVIADEVNTLAAELLGDILLEEDGSGAFAVIEDYLELAESLF